MLQRKLRRFFYFRQTISAELSGLRNPIVISETPKLDKYVSRTPHIPVGGVLKQTPSKMLDILKK